MTRPTDRLFYALLAATAAIFVYLIGYIFWVTPVAQLQAGGLAQKIFYFHVPSAYAMYLCGGVCCVASGASPRCPADQKPPCTTKIGRDAVAARAGGR